MPDQEERETSRRAKRQLKRGRAPSSAAGEFVREEMHHIRRGKHGARSTKQAIAIGLSKARRAGVPLKPRGGSRKTRQSAQRAYEVGQHERKRRSHSRARSRAISRALRREPHRAASRTALGSQARAVSRRRGPAARSAAARKAVQTKGVAGRRAAARKAARTRARHAS
ncbi:MAG TPA: DUF6496 domain-containing protein [Kofleriaceae bacterium]|nr:DUF6496 domain-containing protein [Kofleriaceae bacterium]